MRGGTNGSASTPLLPRGQLPAGDQTGATLRYAANNRNRRAREPTACWVVERTFGWLMRYRRLARDHERRTDHHEAMVYWATVMIMTRRLARYQAGQPPEPRWGGERKTRAQPQAQAA